MIDFPQINPVALEVGPLKLHWYGISYLVGIGLGWLYLRYYVSKYFSSWPRTAIDDLVFYCSVGAVLGGRIGYVLFYDLQSFFRDPFLIFAIWKGGMSFHGGVIGVLIAVLFLHVRMNRTIFEVSDFLVPAVPIGLFFGRLANFVNQELWGTPSGMPWAVVFSIPTSGGLPRHPSQLYEAFLEGIVIFSLLNFLIRRRPRAGMTTAAFLILYGIFRIFVEFFRAPDSHIGYIIGGWFTVGQLLSLPMLVGGVIIWYLAATSVRMK